MLSQETATLPASVDWSDGPRALVTGAASGIGEACARLLTERGYHVVGFDLRRGLIDIEFVLGSIVDPAQCRTAIELSAPNLVIHAAGIGAGTLGVGYSHLMTDEQWQNVISVNLTGAWNVAKAALACEDVESVLFMGSVSGQVAAPPKVANANYCAAKAGVVGLAKALAVEYAPVRVNVLQPGPVDTPMLSNLKRQRPQLYQDFIGAVPLGRPLTVQEVASMAVAVAENTGMTGSVVVCDGGYTAA